MEVQPLCPAEEAVQAPFCVRKKGEDTAKSSLFCNFADGFTKQAEGICGKRRKGSCFAR